MSLIPYSTLCYFISDIMSDVMIMIPIYLAMTSLKPISLPARLAVN